MGAKPSFSKQAEDYVANVFLVIDDENSGLWWLMPFPQMLKTPVFSVA